ncbi:MAG: hypothetical protein VB046_09565 [Paludibacter sp.]|nr:hypothetical protein [Paludibacter sp.]
MKKFSDLGIKPKDDKNIFNVPSISIQDVVNVEIEILDFEANVKTRHGDGRYILNVRYEGKECKFFTNASPIKQVLDQTGKEDFPFTTIIKQQRFGSGSGKTFYFT